MREDLILVSLGILLGVFSVLGYQRISGPSNYDECLMASVKTWAPTEVNVANRICNKKFPFVKEQAAQ